MFAVSKKYGIMLKFERIDGIFLDQRHNPDTTPCIEIVYQPFAGEPSNRHVIYFPTPSEAKDAFDDIVSILPPKLMFQA